MMRIMQQLQISTAENFNINFNKPQLSQIEPRDGIVL